MEFQNDFCIVRITIDSTYTVQSSDNKKYDLILNPENYKYNDYYKTLSIHINLFDSEMDIALVGDFFSYDYDCAILDGKVLTIMQNDTISQINVNHGKLLLHKKFECFGSNFGLYRVSKGYIVYGETEITMLDFDFNKKWEFSGKDIFVSHTEKKAFELCENCIKLYDWNDDYYELDLDGKLIFYHPS